MMDSTKLPLELYMCAVVCIDALHNNNINFKFMKTKQYNPISKNNS